jgi:GNAT superfamily N-acetyltransferase
LSSRVVRWASADGPADAFARQLCADHPGDLIDVRDPELAAALVAAGATVTRRSLLMVRPIPAGGGAPDPAVDAGTSVEVADMADDPARYAGPLLRAFPPEHPDYDPDIFDLATAEAALRSYFDGSVIGPWLAFASAEARSSGGEVVGGIVIARMPPHDTNPGGPWITDVFVEPSHHGAGIGRALLASAIARLAEAGEDALWLAVQVDNPARRLYERVGFTTDSSWTRFAL